MNTDSNEPKYHKPLYGRPYVTYRDQQVFIRRLSIRPPFILSETKAAANALSRAMMLQEWVDDLEEKRSLKESRIDQTIKNIARKEESDV